MASINDLVKYAVELRKDISPGDRVKIVLKKDQRSGTLTTGVVQRLLTSKGKHTRGIKVKLTNGKVGRVQKKLGRTKNK